jgi:site-specific DNA-methyltransferase (adenine-specific)
MIKWLLTEIPIKDLKDHPKNPRQIHKDQLARLAENMNKFGLIDRPIVNTDLTIIGGHQRIRILKKQKVKTVECWMPDELISEQDVDELCIRLNQNQGSFDYSVLANEFEPLDLLAWGFTEEQLLGCYDEESAEEAEKKEKSVKLTECPRCGHEF